VHAYTQAIKAGEVVLRVPLRLAITDHEEGEERIAYEVSRAGCRHQQ
jgi:hypothetical protein